MAEPPATNVREPFSYADADVIVRSSDRIDFHLHKTILGRASQIFADMFTLPEFVTPSANPQVVEITVEELLAVLKTAEKYDMQYLVSSLEQNMLALLKSKGVEPLRAYAIAHVHKYRDVARAAARLLLPDPQYLERTSQVPELDEIPASALRTFVAYRRACIKAACRMVDDAEWMATRAGRDIWISPKGAGKIMGVENSWSWVSCQNADHRSRSVSISERVERHLLVRDWWIKYNEHAKERLGMAPSGEVVTQTSVMELALEQAMGCYHCAPKAWKDLVDYSQQLAKAIDAAMALVRIELAF
ncbi:hypothetical protein C8Q74DRAFT_1367340 [Fomes fomentarius]|nr:hypothetical protein C8Q74DRAFT_1367340 [Fomes fomentarius]